MPNSVFKAISRENNMWVSIPFGKPLPNLRRSTSISAGRLLPSVAALHHLFLVVAAHLLVVVVRLADHLVERVAVLLVAAIDLALLEIVEIEEIGEAVLGLAVEVAAEAGGAHNYRSK